MSRTLGQERAAFALEQLRNRLSKVSDENKKDFKKDFPGFTAGLPAMILQNGFGQTLAFLLAKAGDNQADKHYIAFEIITDWLREKEVLNGESKEEVMEYISNQMDQAQYLHAQRETLAMLEWLKRFANAELF